MFRKFFSFLSRIFFGKRKKGPPTLPDSTSKEPKKITEGQTQQIEKSKDTEIITTKTIVISGDRIQPAEELPKNEKKDEDEPEKEIKHTVIVETRKTEIFETEEETDDGAETEELKYENVDPDKNPPDYWSKEFQYLYKLIRYRIHKVFEKDVEMTEPLPELKKWRKHLRRFIINNHWENDYEEKVLLLIALAPYLYPDLFNRAIFDELKIHEQGKDKDERSELIERIERMGGIKSNNAPFFLPTGETAVFIMAGNSETKRFHVQNLFGAEHKFWQKKILWLEDLQNDAPPMHGRII